MNCSVKICTHTHAHTHTHTHTHTHLLRFRILSSLAAGPNGDTSSQACPLPDSGVRTAHNRYTCTHTHTYTHAVRSTLQIVPYTTADMTHQLHIKTEYAHSIFCAHHNGHTHIVTDTHTL